MNPIMPEVQSRVKTLGLDLSKNVITACGLNARGDIVLRRNLRLPACHELLAQLPADAVVAMEACGSAHYWARAVQARGLTARMMAADFAAPFRKSKKTKNDANDAEAMPTCAACCPNARAPPCKRRWARRTPCARASSAGWSPYTIGSDITKP